MHKIGRSVKVKLGKWGEFAAGNIWQVTHAIIVIKASTAAVVLQCDPRTLELTLDLSVSLQTKEEKPCFTHGMCGFLVGSKPEIGYLIH